MLELNLNVGARGLTPHPATDPVDRSAATHYTTAQPTRPHSRERRGPMFDIKWIRDHPEAFDAGLKKRGLSPGGDVKFASELARLDEARRKIVTRLQEAQARRNAASKEIGKAKGAKDEAKT